MSTYSDAYNTFRTAESAAALFDNPNWTRSALHKERKARLEAARAAQLNTLPATARGGTAPGAE